MTRLVMQPEDGVVGPGHVHLGLGHHVGLDAVEHAQHGGAFDILSPSQLINFQSKVWEVLPFVLS